MSTKQFKEFISSVFSPVSNLGRKFRRFLKRISKAVRRELLLIGRRARRSGAGFVLPTVTMVMLVVVLLTLSIAFRSFERVNQARNVKINQALLSASTPALDRARAKIEKLLADQTKTPADARLADDLTEVKSGAYLYKLPDEDVVKISFDIDNDGTIEASGEDSDINSVGDNESSATAWRFPVDTDNDGLYDTYNLYGVFFRNPVPNDQNVMRERKPLDARTPPFGSTTSTNAVCQALANSVLVGGSGWYLSDAKLKKSFFAYTVNVPITDITGLDAGKYEKFTGNTGSTALELQQDRTRTLPTTNAVVYGDDLVVSNGGIFRLNGRIVAKSNLMLSPVSDNGFVSYLVSSKSSCYFNADNSKIIVGGNVIAGRFDSSNQKTSTVHLYPEADSASVSSTNQSLDLTGAVAKDFGFSTDGYNKRLVSLIADFKAKNPTSATYPAEVKKAVDEENKELDVAIENYLRDRMRGFTFKEANDTAISSTGTLTGSGDSLRPSDYWAIPIEPGTNNFRTGATIKPAQLEATDPDKVEKDKESRLGDRILVGNNLPYKLWSVDDDRFLTGKEISQDVGTNKWEFPTPNTNNGVKKRYSQIQSAVDVGATDRDGFWELMAGTMTEDPADGMGGLRLVTGAGIYSRTNSFLPPPYWDNPSTTAIEANTTYDDPTTTNTEAYPIVWPDTMPMSPGGVGTQIYDNSASPPEWKPWAANLPQKGDLQMRATAVYHYAEEPIKDKDGKVLVDNGDDDLLRGYQKPVACISSYYDPTDKFTSRNPSGVSPALADVSGERVGSQPATGRSNNGVVYGPPGNRPSSAVTPNSATGLFAGTGLYEQANLVFPNGRFVNKLLRDALAKDEQNRTLAEKSAIDAELCALGILENTLGAKPSYIPDGAIKEVSFLDPRQIKAIHADNTTTRIDETFSLAALATSTDVASTVLVNNELYDQPIEERQPLEIRATQIDLDQLRMEKVKDTVQFTITTTGGDTARLNGPGPEYLLPNSGIIFASRNDALPDLSTKDNTNEAKSKLLSASDFKLDPTRRPNSIVLINGAKLSRNNNQSGDVNKEKGLIMVSDLPVYIKGDFNKHTQEEFTEGLTASTWDNFYTRPSTSLNDQFACRPGDSRLPKCTTGDEWRAATVLSDGVTLLSSSFRYGFRNEGDFDLINNAGNTIALPDFVTNKHETSKIARLANGFFENNFAVNGLSSGVFDPNITDDDYSGLNKVTNNEVIGSSYFNNFITPVQRRSNSLSGEEAPAPEYLMEMCLKLTVSACELDDWIVGYDTSGDLTLQPNELIPASNFVGTNGNPSTNYPATSTGFDITKLGAGTTARPPLANYQRFPRRITLWRNDFGRLELDDILSAPVPLGITGTTGNTSTNDGVKAFPYTATSSDNRSASLPRTNNNSLLYWTSRTIDGYPYDELTNISSEMDQPLYYYPYEGNFKLLNPALPKVGTFEFTTPPPPPPPPATRTLTISDYTFCSSDDGGWTGYKTSQEPKDYPNTNELATPSCDSGVTKEAGDFVTYISGRTADKNATLTWNGTTNLVIDAIGRTADTADDLTDTNSDGVLVYQLPSNIATTLEDNSGTPDINEGILNITIYANKNQVVVFKAPVGTLTIGNATTSATDNNNAGNAGKSSVQMKIVGGIEPNNIFWSIPKVTGNNNGDVVIKNAISEAIPHKLIGNFFGDNGGDIIIGENTVLMGRIIGFTGKQAPFTVRQSGKDYLPVGTKVIGVSSPQQPLFVPLLNVYLPGQIKKTRVDEVTTARRLPLVSSAGYTRWLQTPSANHEYNLIIGSYDTPTRPDETNGSLDNFPRFIENWCVRDSENCDGPTVTIRGGFYQLGRSKFANAPFLQIKSAVNPVQASVTTPSVNAGFDYMSTFTNDPKAVRYDFWWSDNRSAPSASNAYPFYSRPNREWGYDTGLLSQIPDLFAQRLSTPNPKPNEYFREVGRDDPWVKALLCGKVDNTLTPNTYPGANAGTNAVSGEYRPSNCKKYTGN